MWISQRRDARNDTRIQTRNLKRSWLSSADFLVRTCAARYESGEKQDRRNRKEIALGVDASSRATHLYKCDSIPLVLLRKVSTCARRDDDSMRVGSSGISPRKSVGSNGAADCRIQPLFSCHGEDSIPRGPRDVGFKPSGGLPSRSEPAKALNPELNISFLFSRVLARQGASRNDVTDFAFLKTSATMPPYLFRACSYTRCVSRR